MGAEVCGTMRCMSDTKPRRSIWKTARWFVLAALVVVVFLLFKKPAPVAEPMTAAVVKQKADDFQVKLQDLANARQRGEASEARFDSDEVNAAIQQSAAEPAAPVTPSATASSQPAPATEAPPEIKTIQVSFMNDHVTGQFATNLYGKDVYLTISGKLGAANGYATFEFTEAKIGDLPVAISLLNPRLQEKLQEPENHEKLKLPSYVADLRVENGQLVIVEK
jgi:hypothetical protein